MKTLPLKKLLLQKGFQLVAEFSCRGYDTYGLLKLVGGIAKNRPNARDLAAARHFAHQLLSPFNLPSRS